MKKFPRKFQPILTMAMMLPIMLLSMSGIMAYRTLPAGASFLDVWGQAIINVVPPALLLIAVVAPTVRLFVTRVLLEPEY